MRAEFRLVAAGLALILLHTIDEAFVHPEAGGGANVVAAAVICVLAAVGYRRLPWWRGVVALVLGLNAAVQASMGHVAHLLDGTARAGDWSGVAMVAGGLLLMAATPLAIRARSAQRATERGTRANPGDRPGADDQEPKSEHDLATAPSAK